MIIVTHPAPSDGSRLKHIWAPTSYLRAILPTLVGYVFYSILILFFQIFKIYILLKLRNYQQHWNTFYSRLFEIFHLWNWLVSFSTVQICPIKASLCNLHTLSYEFGINFQIDKLQLRQFLANRNQRSGGDWVESGGIKLGPISVNSSRSQLGNQSDIQRKIYFLRLIDQRSKRLFFLNRCSDESLTQKALPVTRCGCFGNCAFFGSTALDSGYYTAKSTYEMQQKLGVATSNASSSPPGQQSSPWDLLSCC